jgi:hypothetical protein
MILSQTGNRGTIRCGPVPFSRRTGDRCALTTGGEGDVPRCVSSHTGTPTLVVNVTLCAVVLGDFAISSRSRSHMQVNRVAAGRAE